ncbi:hypothetical protein H4219_000684 [Mycoemilia scoparia]|uniref:Uncharacterized protein n=1 Tax=Mycoemilia scoparia TaxID=417184 RepID=A0A9W8A8J0_9FUNG|nr:hypothetical protein H4219_000684 [Mycoemilia scoparia]
MTGQNSYPESINKRRLEITREILSTEKSYVNGLLLIEKVFLTPLLNTLTSPNPILTRKGIRRLFANFPDIINFNKTLLLSLEERLENPEAPWNPEADCIGDIFVNMAPFMKMYSLYVRNFHSVLSELGSWISDNMAFSQFLKEANKKPECQGLDFQSYMLLPVQRIPRYKMLLNDLLKHTPEGHPDCKSLENALNMISEVATFVNENIREHEMSLRILEIQRSLNAKEMLLAPGRKVVKQGALTKICKKNHQRRQFYLFTDILIYANSGLSLVEDSSAYQKISLDDCKILDQPKPKGPQNQFTIVSPEESFIVYTDSPESKASWVSALSTTISEHQAAKSTLQMDQSLKRRMAKARRNTMINFPRVVENYDAPVWDPDESATNCFICYTEFSFFCRRHHCRACGKLVCADCSRKTIMFAGKYEDGNRERRACDQCVASLFGREALDSPPGTVHKIMGRTRRSLGPMNFFKSLASSSTENVSAISRESSIQETSELASQADFNDSKSGQKETDEFAVDARNSMRSNSDSSARFNTGRSSLSSKRKSVLSTTSTLSSGSPTSTSSLYNFTSQIAQRLSTHIQGSPGSTNQDWCATTATHSSRHSVSTNESPSLSGSRYFRNSIASSAGSTVVNSGSHTPLSRPSLFSAGSPIEKNTFVITDKGKCLLCRSSFTIFNPKSQCSRCQRNVCSECISKRQTKAGPDHCDKPNSAAPKVCDICVMGVDPNNVVSSIDGTGWHYFEPSGSGSCQSPTCS